MERVSGSEATEALYEVVSKFPSDLPNFGGTSYRGIHPTRMVELRNKYLEDVMSNTQELANVVAENNCRVEDVDIVIESVYQQRLLLIDPATTTTSYADREDLLRILKTKGTCDLRSAKPGTELPDGEGRVYKLQKEVCPISMGKPIQDIVVADGVWRESEASWNAYRPRWEAVVESIKQIFATSEVPKGTGPAMLVLPRIGCSMDGCMLMAC